MPPLRPRLNRDDREILRIAVPAFAALVSEPLMLLADTAIVGHLGTTPLAGLAIASTVLQTFVGLCIFLAYGTTASVGRHLGAGDMRGAMTTGLNGTWLALLLGAVATLACAAGSSLIVAAFGGSADVGAQARTYLLISAFGIPAMLVVLATTGVLRGLQDLRTPLQVMIAANLANVVLNVALVYGAGMGIAGAATGTVLAQWGAAAYLSGVVVRSARRHSAPLRPDRRGITEAANAGVALVVRTLTLRASLLLATFVAAAQGDVPLAAHQVAVTVVSTLTFALDAIAIAGQAMTGKYLGAEDVAGTRRTTRRMTVWGGRLRRRRRRGAARRPHRASLVVQLRPRGPHDARAGPGRGRGDPATVRGRVRPRRCADRGRRRHVPRQGRAGRPRRVRTARARRVGRRRRAGVALGRVRRVHPRSDGDPRRTRALRRLAGHRRAPDLASVHQPRAASTTPRNRPASTRVSGCHWTASQNGRCGSSMASSVPSAAYAAGSNPGCARTDWWW